MVFLIWVRSNPRKLKTLVFNLVKEIQTYTTPTRWKHCAGLDNPAVYLPRGANADQLECPDIWWGGRTWISKGVEFWPCEVGTTEQFPPEERRFLIQSYTARLLLRCLMRQVIAKTGV